MVPVATIGIESGKATASTNCTSMGAGVDVTADVAGAEVGPSPQAESKPANMSARHGPWIRMSISR